MTKPVAAAAAPSPRNKSKRVRPTESDLAAEVEEVTEEIMAEKLGPAAKLPPSSPGPLQVFTPTGKLIQSNAPTLIGCLQDLSRRVGEVTCLTVPLNKGDCGEFQEKYDGHTRPPSPTNVAKLMRRFNQRDYIRDYPSLAFDAVGDPFNGGHTTKALIGSDLESWPFVVVLGVDPKMGPREDTNKIRDLIDQCYYLEKDVYGDKIKGKKSQRTFTASASYIFSSAVACKVIDIGLKPSEAKKEIVQHELGQKLLEKCSQPYIQITAMLDRLAGMEEDEDRGEVFKSFKRVAFLVPAIMLYLAGYKDWPEKIMVPDSTTGPLYRAHEYLWTKADDEGGPEMTIRREQVEILHVVNTVLAYAYAAAHSDQKAKLPLKRWEKVKILKEGPHKDNPRIIAAWKKADGDMAYVWDILHTRKQKAEDTKIRKEIAAFFLNKISFFRRSAA